jgi:hypothetical protein
MVGRCRKQAPPCIARQGRSRRRLRASMEVAEPAVAGAAPVRLAWHAHFGPISCTARPPPGALGRRSREQCARRASGARTVADLHALRVREIRYEHRQIRQPRIR